MVLLKNTCTVLLFCLCGSFSPMHHGWANYDQKKVLDYTGVIQESAYESPHATIKVTDKGYPHKQVKDEMRAERVFINDQKYELR